MTAFRPPKGELFKAIAGGPNTLNELIGETCRAPFSGYIRISAGGGMESKYNAFIIILRGTAVLAYYVGDERLFGQKAMPAISDLSSRPASVLKVFSYSAEDEKLIEQSLQRESAAARVELSGNTAVTVPPPASGSPAGAGVSDERRAVAKEELRQLLGIPDAAAPEVEDKRIKDFLRDITGVEAGSADRLEQELAAKEVQIRTDIQRKLDEREELKAEEEKFLRLDDIFTKLLREREELLRRKEDEIRRKEAELGSAPAERPKEVKDLEARLRAELEQLTDEREEMKKREAKVKEMEAMFRRILTNTEERLKKKEEELLQKEEELKSEVEVRRQMLQELREREEKLKQMEAQLLRQAERRIQDEFKAREDRLRIAEEELAKRAASIAGGRPPDPELVALLVMLDDLLGSLEDRFVAQFAASDVFPLYERVLQRYGIIPRAS